MKIIDKRKKTVPYDSIEPGELFEFDRHIYIKLFGRDTNLSGVDLHTGGYCVIDPKTQVEKINNVELIIS